MLDIVNDKMSQRVVFKKVKCFLITIVSITFRQLDINVLRILRLVLSRNLLYIFIGIEYNDENRKYLSYMILQQIEMRYG